MNKSQAKKEAYAHAALLIRSALNTGLSEFTDMMSGDPLGQEDNARILEGLDDIVCQLERRSR